MSNWVDEDDAPILTAEIAARAELRVGDKIIRPATGTYMHATFPANGCSPKRQVILRRDAKVLNRSREGGPG